MWQSNWQRTVAGISSRHSLHGLQTERGTTLSKSASHLQAVKTLVFVAFTAFGVDFVSKSLVSTRLSSGSHPILGHFLQFERVDNSGAAFSLATHAALFFAAISASALAGIYVFARSLTSRAWAAALGLLTGGIVGNLSDRLFRPPYWARGSVVDWIRVPHWPVFNLADSSIVISAVAIALLIVRNVKPRSRDDY
jgi:signal peptidase II